MFNNVVLRRSNFSLIDRFSKAFFQLKREIDYCIPSAFAFL